MSNQPWPIFWAKTSGREEHPVSLDRLEHKKALFAWSDLFNTRYEVLLYDLTSTYFECDPPGTSGWPNPFGYSLGLSAGSHGGLSGL